MPDHHLPLAGVRLRARRRPARERGADIVTSAATAEVLALFHRQARERGARPRLITRSRWLAYPRGATLAELDRRVWPP
ncbi:hypothetical protein [Streptomyces olivaceiscleroticus]|uniref:Uncharacterized protein n=1 Tax=Streptomyces olivaceiscleroticus TaxID=68245 RepID=A0ABP3JBY9_9ACTN